MAITCLVRMRGEGIDSFMGFEYLIVITLTSRVSSTSSDSSYEPAMFAHFWLRRGRMVLRPHLYCLPSRFTLVRSLYWVLGFCGVRPGYCCVGDDRCADCGADSSASLAQCCSCGGFLPSFAIFALVWGLLFFLRNFSFYS